MSRGWPAGPLLAAVSGAALAVVFPNYNVPYIAWVALCPLFIVAVQARPARAAMYGFVHGAIFYPITLTWIYQVMRQYGGLGVADAAGVLALMTVAASLFPAFLCLVVAWLGRSSTRRALFLAPFLWVALEFARTHLPFIGFPWNLTGYAASGELALAQLVTLTGIYGLTFVVVGFNALLAWAVVTRRRDALLGAVGATALLILVVAAGPRLVPTQTPQHVAHLVQTDFPQSERYPPNWLELHAGEMDELEKISTAAGKNAPGLVVWPEVPAPFSLEDPKFAARADRIARSVPDDFLVGVVEWRRGADGKYDAYNSSVLLDGEGRRLFEYDKIHLVPFGEYVPLRQYLGFAKRLTADISDFAPGDSYRLGTIVGGTFGLYICYEAIFPGEIRHFAASGAELLINISNDGWFGRDAAPAQHLMMSRVRAVESRRWLLRDTNNGYTVAVDPYGRYVAQLAPDIRGELDAPYDFRTDRTIYVRFGDWFCWLCVMMCAVLFVAETARRRQ